MHGYSMCQVSKGMAAAGLAGLVRQCPELESLALSDCRFLTDRSFATIRKQCPRLCSLSMSACTEITGAGLTAFYDTAQQAPSGDCSLLRELGLQDCHAPGGGFGGAPGSYVSM